MPNYYKKARESLGRALVLLPLPKPDDERKWIGMAREEIENALSCLDEIAETFGIDD